MCLFVVIAATGCAIHPTPVAVHATPPPTVAPAPVPTPTAPKVTPAAHPPAVPMTRWDKVPRGALPAGCTVHGSPVVMLSGGAGHTKASAKGPSVTCRASTGLVARAMVKLAARTGARWKYVEHAGPSVPQRLSATSRTTPARTCTPGTWVRAVGSFVFTRTDGTQVRLKLKGTAARCS